MTARTAGLLMPRPKAMVPTRMRTSSAIHFSWFSRRARALHLAVVADGGDAVFFEEVDGFADAGDGGGVDDDAAVGNLPHGAKEEFILRAGVGLADDVAQIGAAKAGDVLVRIAKAELVDDVAANAFGGAGGEGGDGEIGKNLAEAAELAVFRAEFVAPLGDAMGFVDGEEGDRETLEPVHGVAEGDALGRKIKQLVFAGGGLLEDVGAVFRREWRRSGRRRRCPFGGVGRPGPA